MSGIRNQVELLLEAGLDTNQIAWRLGLAEPTVSYHIARIREARQADDESSSAASPRVAPRRVGTREAVAALLERGLSRGEVSRRLGIAKSTVSYHARRLGGRVDGRCARRYDWAAVQAYYDLGHSVRECQARFGFSRQTWHAAVQRGAIKARPGALPIDKLLVAGTYRSRHNLKLRLLKEGLKQPRCEKCGLSSWQGLPISFALHHRNGDRDDNRLENLVLLCPNCHSQTDTFAGRNGHRRRA